ncbi:response regulator transcription factor [Actinoplanes sp. NPDC000266]
MEDHVDFGPWMDLAGRAFDPAEDAFPVERIAELLRETLRARGVSFNWATPSVAGAHVWPPLVATEELADFLRRGLRNDRLVCWFETTRNPAPQLDSRVPPGFGDESASRHWLAVMRREGLGDRLSIPVRLEPGLHIAFVAASGGRTFTEADIGVARRLQPLLQALLREADVVRGSAGSRSTGGADLTSREFAVLRLLAQCRTATAIARRLGISERTVQKHLENLYRKLDVGDRLGAVLAGQRAGLLRVTGAESRPPDTLFSAIAPPVTLSLGSGMGRTA